MKRILIIEDELLLAMDMERVLQDAGYDVVGLAVDQREALAAADQAELAVVDLNLRDGLTGPQIAHILADRHGTKVIYVTANPSLIRDKAETAVGVLMKPFSDAALLAAVSYAEGRQLQPLPHQFKPFAEATLLEFRSQP